MSPQEVKDYNEMIKKWSAMVRRKMLSNTLKLTKGKVGTVTRGSAGKTRIEYKLRDNLFYRTRYSYGEIESVGYSFERHGVFVHKGVGRGYIMIGNTVVRGRRSGDSNNRSKSKERDAMSVILTGRVKRKPVDWFNKVIDKNVPELANKVAEMNADAAVNALRLRIV